MERVASPEVLKSVENMCQAFTVLGAVMGGILLLLLARAILSSRAEMRRMSIIIFALLIIPAVSHANVPPPASLSDLFQIDCRNEQCEEHYQAKENYGTLSFEKSGNLVFQFPDGRTITLFEKKELKPVSQEVRKGLKGAAVIMTQPSEGQVELRGVDIDTHQFLELLIIQMNGE